jgi:hypothetical protein
VLPPRGVGLRRWLSGNGGTPTDSSAYVLCGAEIED